MARDSLVRESSADSQDMMSLTGESVSSAAQASRRRTRQGRRTRTRTRRKGRSRRSGGPGDGQGDKLEWEEEEQTEEQMVTTGDTVGTGSSSSSSSSLSAPSTPPLWCLPVVSIVMWAAAVLQEGDLSWWESVCQAANRLALTSHNAGGGGSAGSGGEGNDGGLSGLRQTRRRSGTVKLKVGPLAGLRAVDVELGAARRAAASVVPSSLVPSGSLDSENKSSSSEAPSGSSIRVDKVANGNDTYQDVTVENQKMAPSSSLAPPQA